MCGVLATTEDPMSDEIPQIPIIITADGYVTKAADKKENDK